MTEYTLTATTAVRGAASEQLANAMSTSFTTRDGSWSDPVLVETNSAGAATKPQLAFDASGNAIAVWQQHDGTRWNIWASRFVPGSGWEAPTLIEAGAGTAASPKVAMNASGAAVVIWEQVTGTTIDIWSNRYTPANGWSGAVAVKFPTTSAASGPVVGIDATGQAHAAWVWDSLRIDRARSLSSGAWSANFTISSPPSTDIQVAVDDAGDALFVWRHQDGSRWNIHALRVVDGAAGPDALLSNNAGDASMPQISGDANGNAHVVWMQERAAGVNDIWTNRYTAGAGWGVSTLLENQNGTATFPRVALAANGDAHAVWTQASSTESDIQSARYTTAGGWGPQTRIDVVSVDAVAPMIAVDPVGNAIAVWQYLDAPIASVWTTRYVRGRGWGAARALEFTDQTAAQQAIAIDATGNALALWQQSDGVTTSIWSSRFE
jgi:hypothetical protein